MFLSGRVRRALTPISSSTKNKPEVNRSSGSARLISSSFVHSFSFFFSPQWEWTPVLRLSGGEGQLLNYLYSTCVLCSICFYSKYQMLEFSNSSRSVMEPSGKTLFSLSCVVLNYFSVFFRYFKNSFVSVLFLLRPVMFNVSAHIKCCIHVPWEIEAFTLENCLSAPGKDSRSKINPCYPLYLSHRRIYFPEIGHKFKYLIKT